MNKNTIIGYSQNPVHWGSIKLHTKWCLMGDISSIAVFLRACKICLLSVHLPVIKDDQSMTRTLGLSHRITVVPIVGACCEQIIKSLWLFSAME